MTSRIQWHNNYLRPTTQTDERCAGVITKWSEVRGNKLWITTCSGAISSVCESALHTLLLQSRWIEVWLSGFYMLLESVTASAVISVWETKGKMRSTEKENEAAAPSSLAMCLHCLTVSLWRAACLSSQCPFPWPCYWHGLVSHLLSDQITFCDHWLRCCRILTHPHLLYKSIITFQKVGWHWPFLILPAILSETRKFKLFI